MRVLLGALVFLVAVPVACTSEISVFGGGSGGDEGGDGGASSSTGGGSAEGGAGGALVATVVTGVTTTATATSTVTTTATTSVTTSTTSGGVMASIPCDNEICTGGEVCCVHAQNPDFEQCAPPGQCPSVSYIEVHCNGPNDCAPNEVCCGHFVNQVGYTQVTCDPTCTSGAGYDPVVMCGDDPSICMGRNCTASNTLPDGHAYCP